jgi:hypothetical protein
MNTQETNKNTLEVINGSNGSNGSKDSKFQFDCEKEFHIEN